MIIFFSVLATELPNIILLVMLVVQRADSVAEFAGFGIYSKGSD